MIVVGMVFGRLAEDDRSHIIAEFGANMIPSNDLEQDFLLLADVSDVFGAGEWRKCPSRWLQGSLLIEIEGGGLSEEEAVRGRHSLRFLRKAQNANYKIWSANSVTKVRENELCFANNSGLLQNPQNGFKARKVLVWTPRKSGPKS